jgi:hypothetical protein
VDLVTYIAASVKYLFQQIFGNNLLTETMAPDPIAQSNSRCHVSGFSISLSLSLSFVLENSETFLFSENCEMVKLGS